MIKKIAIAYALIAIAVGVVTTMMQVQPALFFIELLTDSSNRFPLKMTALITILALLLPLVPVLLVVKWFDKSERDTVPDLTDKTGILVHRKRALPDALYTNHVMVNGEKKSGLSNGKSTFVELLPGSYKVFVKGATVNSPVMDVSLLSRQVLYLKTGYRIGGLKNTIYLEADQEKAGAKEF